MQLFQKNCLNSCLNKSFLKTTIQSLFLWLCASVLSFSFVDIAQAAVPATPVANSAIAGAGQVTLNWDGVSDASSYKLYYGTVSGVYGTPRSVGNVTTYTLTGLSAGKTYYFVIGGVNTSGEGTKSNELTALTIPGVSSISLTGGKNQVKATWAAVASATAYTLYYGTAAGVYGTPVNPGNVTTYTLTGLNSSTAYYIVVTASNATGEGAKSAEKSAVTFPDPPAAITLTGAVGGVASATINWNALPEATGYKLYYGTASGVYGTPRSVGNVTTYTLTGLSAGKTYYFAVTGVNTGGEGPQSNELSAITIPGVPSVSLLGGKNQVKVTWAAVASATSYTLYYGTAAGIYPIPVNAGNVTTYTLTGLNSSTAYYVVVTASNATGEGAKSAEKSAVTFPDPPAAITLTGAVGGVASATISWNALPEATGYKLYYGTASGVYGIPRSVGNVTTYTLTGLSAGKTYYFAVTGVNTGGEGSQSNELSALTIPGVPSVSLSGGKNQLIVKWAAVASATSYTLYYGTAAGVYGTPVNPGNVTTYTLTGLNSSTAYYIVVTASNATGEGAKSVEKSVVTLPDAPSAPLLTSATGGTASATISWNALPEATGYKLYYGTASGVYGAPRSAGNVTTYTLTGLSAGKTYYFAVTGVNTGGEGSQSNELSALTIPGVPSVSLSGGKNQLIVKWAAVASATSYTLYYGTAAGVYGTPVNPGNVTTYTLTGLNSSTAYYIVVTASNATGEGAKSAEKSVVTLPDAPSAPLLTSATGGTASATISWNALPEATGYKLYYGTSTGIYGSGRSVGNVTTYSLTGLVAGKTYYFAVTGVNTGGEGAKSNELSALTIPGTASISLAGGKNQVKVSWGALASATSYTIYYGTAPGVYGTSVNAGSVTTYTITALDSSTTYYFALSAVNATGQGAKSVEKNVTTYPEAPTAPVLTTVTGGTASAVVNWNGLTEATSYKLYYGTTPGAYTGSKSVGNVTAYTLAGLSAGKTYYFAVSGVNIGGEGAKSNEVSALTLPGAPSVTLTGAKNQITVKWGAVTSATAYRIYYGIATGVYGAPIEAGNGTTYTVTGLNAATTYYVVVTAINATGEGARSAEKSTVTPLPDVTVAPVLNTATGGAKQVVLNWGAVTGATSYKVYYGTATGIYGPAIDVGDLTTYTATGLTSSSMYYFVVTAVNANGESAKSNEKNATTLPDAPGAPSLNTVTGGAKQAVLGWGAIAGAVSYKVYYGIEAGVYGDPIEVGNLTAYTLTGLGVNSTYYFVVTAVNAGGEGPRSNEKSTTTLPNAPDAPVLNMATGGAKQLMLDWTSVAGANTYQVYYGTAKGVYAPPIEVGSSTTYAVSGLNDATAYYCVVTAVNAGGESIKSNEISATTLPAIPDAPMLNSATGKAKQVVLDWSPSVGAAAYKVYYGTSPGVYGQPVDVANVTSYTIAALNSATTYYVAVSAVNPGGEGPKSNEQSAVTLPDAPVAPALNVLTGGVQQVVLGWGVVAGATSYKVYYGTVAGVYGSPVDVGDVATYTMTGLNSSTKYYVAVTAVNAGGESSKSNEQNVVTLPDAPVAPVLNTTTGGAKQVVLEWGSVAGAVSYKIYYGTAAGVYGAPVDVGNGTTYTISALNSATTYYVVVTAVNAGGESPKSNELSVATLPDAPAAPVLNPSTGGVKQAVLGWAAVAGATSYRVYYGTAAGVYGAPVDIGNVATYTITGLNSATTYYAVVTAVNAGGESAKSNEQNVVTLPDAPAVPTLSTTTGGAKQVVLGWGAIAGATSYKVYYGTAAGVYGAPVDIGNVTTYTLIGLNSATTYYMVVTAVNAGGESSKSGEKNVATLPDVPTAPAFNSVTGGAKQIALIWGAVSGATSYKIYYGTAAGVYGAPIDAGNATAYTITGLNPSTKYYMAVTAVNAGGESSKSNELNATTNAPITVSGPVSVNTTWTLANAPYVVVGDVTVNTGITLTVEPGVEIRFDGNYKISVLGKLNAQGTSVLPIKFTSNKATPVAGDWNMIELTATANVASNISYAEIAYAKTGIFTAVPMTIAYNNIHHNSVYGVSLSSASPAISNNIITNNVTGIYILGANTSNILWNKIINNSQYGISLGIKTSGVPTPVINYNSLYGNTTYNLFMTMITFNNYSSYTIFAKLNWWGVNTSAQVVATIFDHSKSGYLPVVQFSPFLSSAPSQLITFSNTTVTSRFFDPRQSSTQVRYAFDQDANITLKIFDYNSHVVVRTLVNGQLRTAGSYSDIWDGKNDSGVVLPDAVYSYEISAASADGGAGQYGQNMVSSGNEAFGSPVITPAGTFAPSKGDRLKVQYNLSAPAWVSIGFQGTQFVSQQPKDAGANVSYWDGWGSKGLVVFNQSINVDAVATKLPDNAIVIASVKTLDIPVLNTNPFVIRPLYNEATLITYSLNQNANVTVKILTPDGNTVLSVLTNNEVKSPGTYTLTWDGKTSQGKVPVASGDYRVRVQAVDANGQSITRDGNIRVDL